MNHIRTIAVAAVLGLLIAGYVAWRGLARTLVARPVVITELGENRLQVVCDGTLHTTLNNRFEITRGDQTWLATEGQRNELRTSVYQVLSHGRPGPALSELQQKGCNLYLTAGQPQLIQFLSGESHAVKDELVRRMMALNGP
ncbi:hypothetical protein [Deinococcus ficus]|uniref:Uncharacterized protein n=1 Tax=Deinococcus ficus TaxID=317577 RepID=A0A221T2M2_9DEIO|nr:hypothetical protein [Deinococcus ficus]ASN83145.1 hypothetical protein DFI_18260 [Deinococcus ficus]